jgi:D-alanyl-D-alanine carboxypeptidase
MVANRKKAAKKKPTLKKKVGRRKAPRKRVALIAVPAAPADIVNIPRRDTFNKNLKSATEATMLRLFGVPGQKTAACSPATGKIKKRIVTQDVGPFRVSGLDVAVGSLKSVFAEAEEQIPNVVATVKTAGMFCVRHKRRNRNSFSNHSWGTAIDLFFGTQAVPQGTPKTHRGVLQLAPFFNNHGWFWGAGFSGASVDSMHFELSEQAISSRAKLARRASRRLM